MQLLVDNQEIAPPWLDELEPESTVDDLRQRLSEELAAVGRWPVKIDPIGGPLVKDVFACEVATKPLHETLEGLLSKLAKLAESAGDLHRTAAEACGENEPNADEFMREALAFWPVLLETLEVADTITMGAVVELLTDHEADQQRLASIVGDGEIRHDSPEAVTVLLGLGNEADVWTGIIEKLRSELVR